MPCADKTQNYRRICSLNRKNNDIKSDTVSARVVATNARRLNKSLIVMIKMT